VELPRPKRATCLQFSAVRRPLLVLESKILACSVGALPSSSPQICDRDDCSRFRHTFPDCQHRAGALAAWRRGHFLAAFRLTPKAAQGQRTRPVRIDAEI